MIIDLRSLRVRRTDRPTTPLGMMGLFKQRSTSDVTRTRAGDPQSSISRALTERRPFDLTTNKIELIAHPQLPFLVAKDSITGSKRNGERLAEEIKAAQAAIGLRFPTEDELLLANQLLGDQLDGAGDLVWTSTPHPGHGTSFVLRRLGQEARFYNFPEVSSPDYRFRFVLDKK